jgi:hypothetical protein
VVKRFLVIAQADVEQAHRDASPVANRMLQGPPYRVDVARR